MLGAAVVLLYLALASLDQPARAIVKGSVALASYAGSLLCVVGGRQRAGLGSGLWRRGPWTLLWYGIIFGIATIPLCQAQNYVTTQILPADILKALWLVAIAMSADYLAGASGPARTGVI